MLETKNHPTESELSDFLENRLAPEIRRELEDHIAVCDDCLASIVSAYEVVENYGRNGRQKKGISGIMKKININWVTYKGKRMEYYTSKKNDHYRLIVRASWAKVNQNPEVKRVLLATGNLILRPDHHPPDDAPPSWHYFDIYMEIRSKLQHR